VGITEWIAGFGTGVIGSIGYVGVFLLMVAESMVLPVPSEAVMPFAGFLVAQGTLSPVLAVLAATLGSIVGSLASYGIGRFGGKPFLLRFGKFLLLDEADLAWTERFFQKKGGVTILIARFIPIVRHLISIPAGLGRMRIVPFLLFTVLGAGAWNSFLTWAGSVLQKRWSAIMRYSHVIDIVVLALLGILVVLFVARHLKRRKGGAA
jgi:membrane protein DedA with SNARE-associated domain